MAECHQRVSSFLCWLLFFFSGEEGNWCIAFLQKTQTEFTLLDRLSTEEVISFTTVSTSYKANTEFALSVLIVPIHTNNRIHTKLVFNYETVHYVFCT